jgi:hypothetical protein
MDPDSKFVYINQSDSEDEPHPPPEDPRISEEEPSEEPTVVEESNVVESNSPLEEDLPEESALKEDLPEETVEEDVMEGGQVKRKQFEALEHEDETDDESVDTNQILAVDPLYYRLNMFLKSDNGESVANLLKGVCDKLDTLNQNFERLFKSQSVA